MKHLFFDLDKTLWDFNKNSKAALQILFEKLELSSRVRSFQSFHTKYKKINNELWYEYGLGKISKDELRIDRFRNTLGAFDVNDDTLAENLASGYVEISPYQTNLFPKTIETLTNLKESGFTLHIITNGFKEVQYVKLKQSLLIDFFDVIVCSEEVGKNKPAKEVFHHALDSAAARAHESVMIGDDYHVDVLGAQNAGMHGVLFDPENSHKEGTHEWHINQLEEIPGLIPWISKANL